MLSAEPAQIPPRPVPARAKTFNLPPRHTTMTCPSRTRSNLTSPSRLSMSQPCAKGRSAGPPDDRGAGPASGWKAAWGADEGAPCFYLLRGLPSRFGEAHHGDVHMMRLVEEEEVEPPRNGHLSERRVDPRSMSLLR